MLALPQRTASPLGGALRVCLLPCVLQHRAHRSSIEARSAARRLHQAAVSRASAGCVMATDTAEQQAEDTAGTAAPQDQQQQQQRQDEVNGAAQPQWEAAQQPTAAGRAAQRPAWASLPIILGSQSASRRAIMDELAAQLGFSYSTVAAGIDEKLIRDDDPEQLVMQLAHAKAMAIAERWKEEDAVPSEGLLITCDQVVVCDGVVLEKPENEEQARQYIMGYSNSSAQTVGAVRVSNLATGRATASTDCCEVQFGSIPDDVVDQLVAEEATYTCAGGLMVEHPLVAPLITAQFGEQASIMGLPKGLTLELLHKAALMGQPKRTVK